VLAVWLRHSQRLLRAAEPVSHVYLIVDIMCLQADRIQQLYPEAERVGLQSGHCPHDDTPEEANEALLAWLGRVYKS
jgi:hypothetical protein